MVFLAEGKDSGVVGEILRFFLQHPRTAESLEGVARWRLPEAVVQRTVTETKGALEWLVKEGYLVEIKRQGMERMFQLKPEKLAEAQRLASTGER